MREEISRLEDSWNRREKGLEDRMDKFEARLLKMEQMKEANIGEEKVMIMEGIVKKVSEIVKRRERNVREKKERRNNLVIRGLQKEKCENKGSSRVIFGERVWSKRGGEEDTDKRKGGKGGGYCGDGLLGIEGNGNEGEEKTRR